MIDYREILRLKDLGFSNATVANSIHSSRNKVSEVVKLADEHELAWPIPETLTNRNLEELFYPERATNEGRKLPNFEYIYNELAKTGVTLSLLWAEYCVKCEQEHTIPYQHSQFNEKYHAYAASKKATLHIKRKPGELMEAKILDTAETERAAGLGILRRHSLSSLMRLATRQSAAARPTAFLLLSVTLMNLHP